MRATKLARTAAFSGLLGFVTVSLATQSAMAAPVDREACLNSSEQGQKLRQQGKLQEAQKQFQICAQRECPGIVQRDCTQWLTEVSSSLPTVTLSVQDEKGRDIIDVQVSVDGKNLLSRLEGKTIPVDPGVHTFRFEADGKAPLEERVVISEGDKAKKIAVTLKPASGATDAGGGGGTPDPQPKPDTAPGQHTVYPWIVTGTGVVAAGVGLVLYLTGSSDFPAECTRGVSDSCKGNTEAERKERSDAATSADLRMSIGLPVLIGGAVLVAGGLTWFFLEPTFNKKKPQAAPATATVRPQLGFGYAGLSGTF